ncbi:hypothetical protein F5146DRAFT_727444 [Armillaria mellea]|nr:hypothetical protein F5146DRAFT_727444 [Armillaria mellea]
MSEVFAHVWNTAYRDCKQWQTIALSFKQYPSGNSSLLAAVMGPGNDKDAANGTPKDQPNTPAATPAASSSSTQKNESDNIVDKYKKLKRRFFELEEETSSELQRSSERNVRIRQERNMLLERIMELEAQPQFKANGGDLISSTLDQPPSSAFPRSLLTARAPQILLFLPGISEHQPMNVQRNGLVL